MVLHMAQDMFCLSSAPKPLNYSGGWFQLTGLLIAQYNLYIHPLFSQITAACAVCVDHLEGSRAQ